MYKILSSPILRQYAVIITVNLLALCLGLDLGWSSPVLVKLRDPAQTPLSRPITQDEGGWIVSIGYIFSIFTPPLIGFLMDYLGRRYTILMAGLPKIAAGFMTIFATEVWVLFIARVISGITTTAAMLIITVYSTEISSKEIRGSLGIFMTIFSNLGILIMLAVGPYISYLTLSIMVTAIYICACIPLLFVPDTPYSLYNKGKIEEAKKVLIFFRGSQTLAEMELKELSQSKPTQKFDKREILRNRTYLKSLIIVVVMGIGIQFVGFNSISFYLQTILELSNTSVSPALGSVIIGVIQITASILASVFIDRFGRRPILISTLIGMTIGMIGLGIFFMIKHHGVFISGFLNYLPIICIAIVTCCFSGGIGSLFFVITSEILDGPIRALGCSISSVATNLAVFLLSRYTMSMISGMGADATFIMFGVICIMMLLFVIFFVPETKQKTIAEIQRALGGFTEEEEKKDRVSRF